MLIKCDKVNGYGHKVDNVLLAKLDCNLMQVHSGLAWHFKQDQREQSVIDQHSYAGAETEANAAGLSLWREVNPRARWKFRPKSNLEIR